MSVSALCELNQNIIVVSNCRPCQLQGKRKKEGDYFVCKTHQNAGNARQGYGAKDLPGPYQLLSDPINPFGLPQGKHPRHRGVGGRGFHPPGPQEDVGAGTDGSRPGIGRPAAPHLLGKLHYRPLGGGHAFPGVQSPIPTPAPSFQGDQTDYSQRSHKATGPQPGGVHPPGEEGHRDRSSDTARWVLLSVFFNSKKRGWVSPYTGLTRAVF